MSDPQDVAESLDEDVIEDVDDFSGDEVGDDLPEYPPERPLGVDAVGVTAVEEDAGESFAERTRQEVPETTTLEDDTSWEVGQLVDPDATSFDDEEHLIAEEEPGEGLSAEEAAMHIEPER